MSRVQTVLGIDSMVHTGVSVADVNGDGLDDVYLCQSGGVSNRLFVQSPDGTAMDRSAESGLDFLDYSRAALFADFDNDGDQDLAIVLTVRVVLFVNDGSGKFERKADLKAEAPYSLSAADYDGDGKLDLHVCGYATEPPVPFHDASSGVQDYLYHNEGDWSFVDTTVATKIESFSYRFGQAAVWEDFDNDSDVDLYLVNDFGRNNLYRNDAGVFVNVAKAFGAEDVGFGHAVACADFDRDGWMDFYTSKVHSPAGRRITTQKRFLEGGKAELRDLYPDIARGNSLLTNDEGKRFVVSGLDSGAARSGWAFDSRPIDFNNDGHEDLVVANGLSTNFGAVDLESYYWRQFVGRAPMQGIDQEWSRGYPRAWMTVASLLGRGENFHGGERNRCFLNVGGGKFVDVSGATSFDVPGDSRSMGIVDWDRDGDLDVWIAGRSAPTLRLLRNESPVGSHFVALRLQGTTSNRDAIGARVDLLTAGDEVVKHIRTVRAGGGGFLSQSSKWLHFGTGKSRTISRVVVKWPGGEGEQFSGVGVDGRFLLVQGEGRARRVETATVASAVKPSEPKLPVVGLPKRVVLSLRCPLPKLSYADTAGESQFWDPAETRRTLLCLWSTADRPGVDSLKAMGTQWKRFQDAELDVLALSVDTLGGDSDAPRVSSVIKGLALPFAVGIAEQTLVQKLEVLVSGLYQNQEAFPLPMSFLVDQDGYLTAIYRGPVTVDQVLSDLALTELDARKYLESTFPLEGRWNEAPLFPSVSRGTAGWLGMTFGFAKFEEEDIVRFWKSYLNFFDKVPIPADAEEADLWNGGLAKVLVGSAQQDLFRLSRGEDAIIAIIAGMKLKPEWTQLYLNLGDYFRERGGDPARAIEAYLGALPYDDGYAKLATKRGVWTLCCSEDESARDRDRAMKLAQDLHDKSGGEDPSTFDVLAACYAAKGDFVEALRLATEGQRMARSRNAGVLAKKIKARADLYRQKKAYFGLGGIR
jgi:tetratricopeptide (TPR) repeat protein